LRFFADPELQEQIKEQDEIRIKRDRIIPFKGKQIRFALRAEKYTFVSLFI
jgi:hypothetical protein